MYIIHMHNMNEFFRSYSGKESVFDCSVGIESPEDEVFSRPLVKSH